MITLKIGSEERTTGNIEERWIAQQIRKRRANDTPICVELSIRKDNVNMTLSSAACSGSGGGGRRPNRKEQELFDLWDNKGLNGQEINPGMVISFLNEYKRFMS